MKQEKILFNRFTLILMILVLHTPATLAVGGPDVIKYLDISSDFPQANLKEVSFIDQGSNFKCVFGTDDGFRYIIYEEQEDTRVILKILMFPVKKSITSMPEIKSSIIESLQMTELDNQTLGIFFQIKTGDFEYEFRQDRNRLTVNIETTKSHGA